MSTHAQRRPTLTPLLPALLFCATLHTAQREGYVLPDWAQSAYYWLSSGAPMLRHLLTQPGFNESDALLSHFFATTDASIRTFLADGAVPAETQLFTVCNSDARGYSRSVSDVFAIRGLPDPLTDCISDNVDTALYSDTRPQYSIDAVYTAMLARFRILDREAATLVHSVLAGLPGREQLLANWSAAASVSQLEWRRPNKVCSLSVLGFWRVADRWYSDVSLTNAPVTDNLARYKRQFMSELVRLGPGPAQTLAMRVPRYEPSANASEFGTSSAPVDGTTTLLSRFRGQAKMATFISIFPEHNLAMRAATDKADLGARQADDALSPSNLAILFLPVSLNLVPIALFSAVSSRTMLVYTLFSDVLTVIPLAIKGTELIVLGSARYRSVATRITGAYNGTLGKAAAGELWGAECRVTDRVLPAGIAFLSLAAFFLIAGVWAEFWAAAFMRRRMLDAALKEKPGFMRVHDDEEYDDYSYKESLSLSRDNFPTKRQN